MHSRLSLSPHFLIALFLLPLVQIASAGSATWKLDPFTGSWYSPSNWTPATIPSTASDTATFGVSNTTAIGIGTNIELNGIVFNAGASSFTFNDPNPGLVLTISGTGITNNSGVDQNFVTNSSLTTVSSSVNFTNDATAGSHVIFTNNALKSFANVNTNFYDNATAGSATFINYGPIEYPNYGAFTTFYNSSSGANGTFLNYGGNGEFGGTTLFTDSSTAGNAVIVNYGAKAGANQSGYTYFSGSATAGNATITNEPSDPDSFFWGGDVTFTDTASADNATIINNGGNVVGSGGGNVAFINGGDAGNATIINNGSLVEDGYGAGTSFGTDSSAGNSTLIANGGVGDLNYGSISFDSNSSGGTARVAVFGNGRLWFPNHGDLTVGSIEGDGLVDMAYFVLTVGTNDRNTTFSGSLIGGGPLTKVGKGTLTITGRNHVHRGLIITQGTVAVNNLRESGTGAGPVKVKHGTLAGKGIIQGTVTIGGTGRSAALSPGKGATHPNTLTIQSLLTFASDGTYACGFNSDLFAADNVVAAGVTIDPAAIISLDDIGSSIITEGTVFTVINNTAATAIVGRFSNLSDGATIAIGSNTFQANYEGGDGNDLTLTVVP